MKMSYTEELSYMLGLEIGKWFRENELSNLSPEDAFNLGRFVERELAKHPPTKEEKKCWEIINDSNSN